MEAEDQDDSGVAEVKSEDVSGFQISDSGFKSKKSEVATDQIKPASKRSSSDQFSATSRSASGSNESVQKSGPEPLQEPAPDAANASESDGVGMSRAPLGPNAPSRASSVTPKKRKVKKKKSKAKASNATGDAEATTDQDPETTKVRKSPRRLLRQQLLQPL